MVLAVTGGHGEFGSAVLTHLKTLTQEPLVATVRSLGTEADAPGDRPSGAAEDRPGSGAEDQPDRGAREQPGGGVVGVEYRLGDFGDPGTLRQSLAGVDAVLVNATFFGAQIERRESLVTAAIGAAAEAGVRRIVLTSWPQPASISTVQDYPRLEAAVRAAGPSWTILRMSIGLAAAVARDVAWGRRTGELLAPADGAVITPAALTDLAEAAAVALTQPLDGQVLELTGPDAVGWHDLAALADVEFRAVSDDEFIAYAVDNFQLPEPVARLLAELYVDLRGPWASTPTDTLAKLLGRPPLPGLDAVRNRLPR